MNGSADEREECQTSILFEFCNRDGYRFLVDITEVVCIEEHPNGVSIVVDGLDDAIESDEDYDLIKLRYEQQKNEIFCMGMGG